MTTNKPRVLVVDDRREIREAVSRVLRRRFQTVAVKNVDEGLAQLETEQFDAIISDMEMGPGRNGVQFYQEVERAHPALADRFILFTGSEELAKGQVPLIVSKGGDANLLIAVLDEILPV